MGVERGWGVGEEAMWRGWFCSCFLPQIVFVSPISSFFILPLCLSLPPSPPACLLAWYCRDSCLKAWARLRKRRAKRGIAQDLDDWYEERWERNVATRMTQNSRNSPHYLFEANILLTLTWWGFRPILLLLWVPHCSDHAGDWMYIGTTLPQSETSVPSASC